MKAISALLAWLIGEMPIPSSYRAEPRRHGRRNRHRGANKRRNRKRCAKRYWSYARPLKLAARETK